MLTTYNSSVFEFTVLNIKHTGLEVALYIIERDDLCYVNRSVLLWFLIELRMYWLIILLFSSLG